MDDGLPSGSRPPPPAVPPIDYKGVRYLQDLDGPPTQRSQPSGFLLAVDLATGKLHWEIKVYDVVLDPGVEADVQEIYFTSMELVPGRDELLIENEAGARYVVDLRSRAVRKAP